MQIEMRGALSNNIIVLLRNKSKELLIIRFGQIENTWPNFKGNTIRLKQNVIPKSVEKIKQKGGKK